LSANVLLVADGVCCCLKTGHALSCSSSSRGWKWTTARFCWRSRCCQSCVGLTVTRISVSAGQRTVLARQFSYCSRRHHNLPFPISGLLTVRIYNSSTTGSVVGCNSSCTRHSSATPTTWSSAPL